MAIPIYEGTLEDLAGVIERLPKAQKRYRLLELDPEEKSTSVRLLNGSEENPLSETYRRMGFQEPYPTEKEIEAANARLRLHLMSDEPARGLDNEQLDAELALAYGDDHAE